MERGRVFATANKRLFAHHWDAVFEILDGYTWALWRQGEAMPTADIVVRWGPAHVARRRVDEGLVELHLWEGNREADCYAKRGAEAHRAPVALSEGVAEVDRLQACVARWACELPKLSALCGRWHDVATCPPPPRCGGRAGQQRLGPRSPEDGGHQWALWQDDAWQCVKCGATTRLKARRR